MPRMTVWRAVAEALKAEGVPHLFGLPGNPLHLIDDVDKHTDIKIVLVRHEHGGVACAYAYARLTGRPRSASAIPAPASPTASAWRPTGRVPSRSSTPLP